MKIYITENRKLLTDDIEIMETSNKYFQNVVPNLDLKVANSLIHETPKKVLTALSKYQNRPSIKTILKKCNFSFSFKTVSLTNVEKVIKSLDTNKQFHASDIPKKN